MRLTVDTNPIISALLRDSTCRRILLSENLEFNSPQVVLEEIEKYRLELCKRSGYTEGELASILDLILNNVQIVPDEKLLEYLEKADEIIGKIDEKDSQFVAACLATNSEGIWTFDRHFEKQDKIRVFKLEELLEIT